MKNTYYTPEFWQDYAQWFVERGDLVPDWVTDKLNQNA